MRDRLIELLEKRMHPYLADDIADYLLANGVIVPPCKVGDMVWVLHHVLGIAERPKEVLEFKVRSISTHCNSKDERTMRARLCEVKNGKILDHQHDIRFKDFGKTVFLTREEAEKKLREDGK